MNKQEFNNLVLKAQEGDKEALGILVKKNMGLVFLIAKRIRVKDRADDYYGTVSEGKIGLIKAIKEFDINNGSTFSTFATYGIQACMNNYINDGHASNHPIRITRVYNQILSEIIDFDEEFSFKYGRTPSIKEVAKGINRTEKSVRKLMTVKKGSLSLDYVADYSDYCLADLLESKSFENEEFIVARLVLSESIKTLKEKEQKVIRMRYYQDMSQKDVAETLKMTANGVHLLELRVFEKLKKMIGSDYRYETSLDSKKRA